MNIGQAAAATGVTAKRLANAHIAELEQKIAELQSIVDTLSHLAHQCKGDARPDCPIMAGFEGDLS